MHRLCWIVALTAIGMHCCTSRGEELVSGKAVDFKSEIRPILSNRCFACHGPDEATVESGLRLDDREIAIQPSESGKIAIVAGDVDASEMIQRILSRDDDQRMPPPHFGERLTEREVQLLKRWIAQGAPYSKHWSFEPPAAVVPQVADENTRPGYEHWQHSEIDRWVLKKLHEKGWEPSPPADRRTLLRRVALDLTGLPPTLEMLEDFERDPSIDAYEKQVDALLASQSYGEHWGRRWLDLARYADSAGYADDPPRTIWAYRDWVVRALNANMPFDEFTLEQLAGDLLPNPTPEQRIATAFHRNTTTNNEGGTNDEEFRNVAIVDRVNTTMAVWMGLTMACAQCHNHKYDPISQKDYFQVFAILNQSEDADRGDESPILSWYTPEQRAERARWEQDLQRTETQLTAPDESLLIAQQAWVQAMRSPPEWTPMQPSKVVTQSGDAATIQADGSVAIASQADNDTIAIELAVPPGMTATSLKGMRVRSLPDPSLPNGGSSSGDGNFVLTHVTLSAIGEASELPRARFVRVELPGKDRILSLAEVEVYSQGANAALHGKASQSSEGYGGAALRAIDGNTSGNFDDQSVTHTQTTEAPWWEVDLGEPRPLERVVLWNRTDNGLLGRLSGAEVTALDDRRHVVWRGRIDTADAKNELALQAEQHWNAGYAAADFAQSGFDASNVLDNDPKSGWAVGGSLQMSHALSIAGAFPDTYSFTPNTRLRLQLAFQSPHKKAVLARFAIDATRDDGLVEKLKLPHDVQGWVKAETLALEDQQNLHRYYVSVVDPSRDSLRIQRDNLKQQIASIQPVTTVPVLKDLPEDKRRETRIQLRGNYRVTGDVVSPGIPEVFARSAADKSKRWTRLELAHWLVSHDNPLTARVIANRTWESLFGVGIVRTSEEFGSQGDLPSNPELLDHLAIDLQRTGWDMKRFLRSLVLSAAYRQRSSVAPERFEQDPENVFVSRGPRFRVAAEQIRDMALASAGLLSHRLYGPPTRPPQPSMGLNAAFGSRTDWETSRGEDRFRRAIYTQWRRSNPYPSMATFDAPNRDVCILKRDRTNTPLQALVTLNDPVFVEAAQGLARRVVIHELPTGSTEQRLDRIFLHVLSRVPMERERHALTQLLNETLDTLKADSNKAMQLATDPLGPLPESSHPTEMAAWTVVCNVVLNLDEFLMTP